MLVFTLAISCLTTFSLTLIHGPNIPGSYGILFFTALDFTSITSHIHNLVLFLFWLSIFILSGGISLLFSTWGVHLSVSHFFHLFILFMGFSRQEYWSGLPFPSPVDYVWSELSTMTHLSWVALRGMAHSFIELKKAVIHLMSFLWLWFSLCLPSDG